MSKSGVFKTIQPRDYSITPFKVYKSWRYSDTGSMETDGVLRLTALKPNPAAYNGNKVTLDTWQIHEDPASFQINGNGLEPSLLWYSLNHLYYKRAGQPYETFGPTDHNRIERSIFDYASVIAVPQKKFGESIQPGSVSLQYTSSLLGNAKLIDDGDGNLIDPIVSGSIKEGFILLELSADSYKFTNIWDSDRMDSSEIELKSSPKYPTTITSYGTYVTASYNVGNCFKFDGNDTIRIKLEDSFKLNPSDNFSVSIFATIYQPSSSYASKTDAPHILGRNFTRVTNRYKPSSRRYELQDTNVPDRSPTPIDIYVNNDHLYVERTDGIKTTQLSYNINSSNVTTSLHIGVVKKDSAMYLYINGVLVDSNTGIINYGTSNECDIFIGSRGLVQGTEAVKAGFLGELSHITFYNTSVTADEMKILYANPLNTNVIGNVFYSHGMIVLSDPRTKYGYYRPNQQSVYLFEDNLDNVYNSVSNHLQSFNLEFNSTVTKYQHEIICKVCEGNYNFTMNPTIRRDSNPESPYPKSIVSNEYFNPYITTIGLYDQYGQLLVIGKLAGPIQKRDDVDLNFIIKFDI